MNRSRTQLPAILFLAAAALILAPTGASAQQVGRCITAQVTDTIVLPDGSEHPPGSLRLCLRGLYNPVTRLHEAEINGHTVGLFPGRSRTSEGRGTPGPAVVLFDRNDDGNLVLVGYAVPEDGRLRAHWMNSSAF